MLLGARSQALKIVSNSFYGYLGYARSRWYSRACAASVTAYGRHYIQDAIAKAEENGFKVLYGDTDSVMMLLNGKTHESAVEFAADFNSKLPESMELELEDFYRRGIFVGKKAEQKSSGAKKKYAMISYDGRVKIRGFELVRRDWSKIARETQRKILDSIL
ncbi:DNA-directed DNA polymerase, family B, conserved region domain protein, partial [mine drainage metagenome]